MILAGKRLLITGVITKDSIGFHAAERAQRQGATVLLTSFGRVRRMTERAAQRLPEPVEVLELDVNSESDLAALSSNLEERWGAVDGVLHAIAYAPEDALGGRFMTAPAASAGQAFQTSAFSLKALAAAVLPLMSAGGSIVGLDFDAAVAWPSLRLDGGRQGGARIGIPVPCPRPRAQRDQGQPGLGGALGHRRRPRNPRLREPRRAVARAGAAGLGHQRSRTRRGCDLLSASPISPGGSAARSCTSTAGSTRSARRGISLRAERLAPGAVGVSGVSPPTGHAPRTLQRMERWLTSERNVRICAVLGAVAIAFSSILVRLSHASPSTAAIFRCVYALPLLWLIATREDRRLGPRPWRQRVPAIASGVFFAADLLLWHRSIADVGAGLATVLANIQVVLVPLVAWAILSERPARQVLAALPVSLLGVLLISGALEQGAYGRDPTRGTLFGLGAGIAYVGFLLLLRRGRSGSAAPGGTPVRRHGDRCRAVRGCRADRSATPGSSPRGPAPAWLITLALTSQVLGWLLITSSLPRLPAALTSLLLTVQPVGSVALGAVIFAEAPSSLQLIGVALVLAALLGATRSRGSMQITAAGATPQADQAMAGASGSRSRAARMSSSENSGSSSSPARNAS